MSAIAGVLEVARCPEHGLHGARQDCFECGCPVDQVQLIPAERVVAALRETHEISDYITDDVQLGLTIDQQLALTKRLYALAEVLNP